MQNNVLIMEGLQNDPETQSHLYVFLNCWAHNEKDFCQKILLIINNVSFWNIYYFTLTNLI